VGVKYSHKYCDLTATDGKCGIIRWILRQHVMKQKQQTTVFWVWNIGYEHDYPNCSQSLCRHDYIHFTFVSAHALFIKCHEMRKHQVTDEMLPASSTRAAGGISQLNPDSSFKNPLKCVSCTVDLCADSATFHGRSCKLDYEVNSVKRQLKL
jgi:hypothetical protein